MTTVKLSFILLVSLLTASGLMLCATYDVESPGREVKATLHLGTNFPDESSNGRTQLKERAVGIHLGSTHSSVAVFRNPRPPKIYGPFASKPYNSGLFEMVLNEHGSRTTPSCVAFTDSGGVLIGESAKDQAPANSERTVCGIISLLGKRFDDAYVQTYIKTLPYKVVNRENKPHVQVKFKNGETKLFSPEKICAMILGKMKEIAEAYTGKKIENVAVIHHYSLFDKANRTIMESSIMEAGKMVGLFVDLVITSRLAAVLTRVFGDQRALVYNLGGRAFDVSLQEVNVITHGLFAVVASLGDAHLGGQTFDMRVAEYFIALIKSKYNRDISEDVKALKKLEIECEKAKILLSSRDRVMVRIETLADGIALFEEPLTRETFEELNMDLFNKTIDLVRAVMNEGSEITNRHHLDSVVLIGGNARIPKLQHMLKEELGIEPLQDVNPDEALPFLATYLAGAIRDRDVENFGQSIYESYNIFVMPYAEKLMAGLLPSYWSRNISLSVISGPITRVTMAIFEGETPWTKYRRSLGRFEIYYPPNTSGPVLITLKMEVDVNADVRVTVMHGGTSNITTINIPAEQVLYSRKDLQSIFRGRNGSRGNNENAYASHLCNVSMQNHRIVSMQNL